MKRLVAIPLLILYLTAISGAMVQLHFCGDRLTSWSLNKEKNSCCCESGSKTNGNAIKQNDCCSDKTFTLKIASEQSNAASAAIQFLSIAGSAAISMPPAPVYSFFKSAEAPLEYSANAPPGRWQNIPLYKLHSRFTYYG